MYTRSRTNNNELLPSEKVEECFLSGVVHMIYIVFRQCFNYFKVDTDRDHDENRTDFTVYLCGNIRG